MFKCPKCTLTKSAEEFYHNKARKSGRSSYCKPCHIKMQSERERTDRVQQDRRRHRLKQYGLTNENFKDLLAKQDNKCAICRLPFGRADVDHCHRTGKVRGLLCFNCNTGIGKLQDDPVIVQAALNYLVDPATVNST